MNGDGTAQGRQFPKARGGPIIPSAERWVSQMREEHRDILEEAIRTSAGGADFDEMLLRAAKKHLPRRYNVHFTAMLDEVLTVADETGLTNRQAAQALLKELKAPAGTEEGPSSTSATPVRPALYRRPAASSPREVPEAILLPMKGEAPIKLGMLVKKEAPMSTAEPVRAPDQHAAVPKVVRKLAAAREEEKTGPDATLEVDSDAEGKNILDLLGAHPETFSTDMREKLKNVVKVERKKAEWPEAAEEPPDPAIFFKGSQRVPPPAPHRRPEKETVRKRIKKLKDLKDH